MDICGGVEEVVDTCYPLGDQYHVTVIVCELCSVALIYQGELIENELVGIYFWWWNINTHIHTQ